MNKNTVKRIIRRVVHTKNAGIDPELVKRREDFLQSIFLDKSAVKALLLKVPL